MLHYYYFFACRISLCIYIQKLKLSGLKGKTQKQILEESRINF